MPSICGAVSSLSASVKSRLTGLLEEMFASAFAGVKETSLFSSRPDTFPLGDVTCLEIQSFSSSDCCVVSPRFCTSTWRSAMSVLPLLSRSEYSLPEFCLINFRRSSLSFPSKIPSPLTSPAISQPGFVSLFPVLFYS